MSYCEIFSFNCHIYIKKEGRFKISIRPEDIYNRLVPEQKEQFDNIQIVDATIGADGSITIDCFALTDKVKESKYRLHVLTGDQLCLDV